MLPVTHLPGAVFAAPCVYRQDQLEEVKRRIVYPEKKAELMPFLLREGKLYSFQDLGRDGNPFAQVTDTSEAETLRAESLWEDPEGRRRYVQLLNRSLFKLAGRTGVRYDPEHRRFYFVASADGGERSFKYTSLKGRSTTRRVAWPPKRKSDGHARGFWYHLAAGLSFQQFSPRQWCLSVRPERHLTQDGEEPLSPKQIGPRVTRLKARMYNDLYLGEVHFWREVLSGGKPRIHLDFGNQAAIIEKGLVDVGVSWPGVPDDDLQFEDRAPEEGLFTLADLDEATSGEELDWQELDEETG